MSNVFFSSNNVLNDQAESDEYIYFTMICYNTGEKLYNCDVCEKYFSQKRNLISHLRTHTVEQLYNCNDKSFSQNNNLINHQRMHTGEKPYQCNARD